jgi:hypothetical protein
MNMKQTPQRSHDLETAADDALQAARSSGIGAHRSVEGGGLLRNAADKEKMIFLSAARLEEKAAARIREAVRLPLGEARQHALNNAAQLRSYAAMKRLLVSSRPSDSAEAKR